MRCTPAIQDGRVEGQEGSRRVRSWPAFEKAARDFKTALNNDSLYDEVVKTKSIDDVYDATDALQAEYVKKGPLRRLSKIQPYLERLRAYTSVIDTFVQVKPDIMALIWGPIKLLLQWTSNLTQSLDAIINITAEIGELLPEFKDMTIMFTQNEHLKDVMALFFQDILDFYLVAMKFFGLSRWRYVFESMWPKQKDKIKLTMSHIERHTGLMRNEVRLEHIHEQHDHRLRALEHFERAERSSRQQEYNTIETRVSPPFYDNKLSHIRNRVCEGTGKWLLQDDAFIKWLDVTNASTGILWLYGIPGAGKTCLAATAIDRAMTSHRTIFAFLSHDLSSGTTALSVLHSLIFQLASEDEQLQTVLCESTRSNLKNHVAVAAVLLQTLLSCAGPVCVVIDGVDEIGNNEQEILLRRLIDLSKACQETRILISSRAEHAIERILDPVSCKIRVDTRNAGSIQAFINDWTQRWFSACGFSPRDKGDILSLLAPLSAKAKGMFLYVQIILDNIELFTDMEEIRNELRVLPESLDKAYERVFRRINGLQPLARTKCRLLLAWTSCSPTPLTKQELEQALVVNGSSGSSCRVSSTSAVIRLCRPIVEEVDDYVRFVHFTVKEYINNPGLSDFIDITEATLSLAKCCIEYLCQDHHDPLVDDSEFEERVLLGDYRLHYYATTTWLELVEQYLRLTVSKTPSPELISALKTLDEERSQSEHGAGIELEGQLFPPELQNLKSHHADLFLMLRDVARFRQKCSTSQYRLDESESWITLDPLTTSSTSSMLYEVYDRLRCQIPQHRADCCCDMLEYHYGRRPYQCVFMGCPLRRQGFKNKALRDSHNKHHDIPWKCNVVSCHYAETGFLSRRMRDDHLGFHLTHDRLSSLVLATDPDPNEVQPLLFDLVLADDTAAVERLLPHAKALPFEVKQELWNLAAYSASSQMLDIIYQVDRHMVGAGCILASIKAHNIGNVTWLLSKIGDEIGRRWVDILVSVIRTGSMDMLQALMLSFLEYRGDRFRMELHRKSLSLEKKVIGATDRNPDREKLLLSFWHTLGSTDDGWRYSGDKLGAALGYVAQTTCSLPLAQALLQYGAQVNLQKQTNSRTPLHFAAQESSQEAAEFIKFLLYQGADPERGIWSSGKQRTIWEEKGAQEIEKWLNMSWDDLVKKVKEDREAGVIWPL